MDRVRDYLETNIKLAYKSVTYNIKQFIWFYLALFIVQLVLGIFTTSMNISEINTRKYVEEKYKAHYVFYYMNENQKLYLEKAANYYFKEDYFFDIKDIKEYGEPGDADYKCDVSIVFAVEPEEGYERFEREYLSGLKEYGTVYSSPTPLFEIEDIISSSNSRYNLYIILSAAFSFVILCVLYNIRTNNFRFDYGIYMAFGADKNKLFNTSFWEMTLIAFLTFIPSMVSVFILNFILTNINGTVFAFSFILCLRAFIVTLIINALAVLFSIVKTAIKRPVSLIVAGDNSNLVHSPRVSVNILKKRKMGKMLRLSMIRYAKYYTVLVLTGVLFAALFVAGIFCANKYNEKQNEYCPQYEVTFDKSVTYTEEDRELFLVLEGITETFKEQSVHVMAMDEHIVIDKANAKPSANRVVLDDESLAMDNVMYYAADSEIIDYLEKHSDYTGDMRSVLENKDTIIITDSFENTTHFDFKPGDKIKLADYYTRISEPDMYLFGKDLLKERLRCYIFRYKEVTIGAVIHNNHSDENLKIYMSHSLFEEKSEQKVDYKKIYLYTDPSMDYSAQGRLYNNILKITKLKYRGEKNTNPVFVKNLYHDTYTEVEARSNLFTKLLIISYLMLPVSAIVWFFSQTLFYQKRRNEFTLLRSVGMKKKDIWFIYFYEAIILSVIGLLFYLLMSYLFCFAIYKLMNSWVFMYSFRYTFEIPKLQFIMGGLLTVVLAFVSTLVTYFLHDRKTDTTVPEV